MKIITHILASVTALLSCALVFVLSSCDASDPSQYYDAQKYTVGSVALNGSLDEQQRSVIGQLLNDMVYVEPCQFWMGAQSRLSTRANYYPGYTALSDSLKITVSVDENGDTTYIKNNWYVDYVHVQDKRAYRHTLPSGKVRMDTIYFTQIYRMPTATGSDNGNLWVSPVTAMDVPNGYYIGKYEISQAQWKAVMGSVLPTGRRCIEVHADESRNHAWYEAVGLGDNYPAYNVWYADAVAFCDRLNQLCGFPNAEGLSFRLPTEVEWECAARGGRYSRGYRYPGSDDQTEVAWMSINAFSPGLGSSAFGMHQHGELAPNELGIYDMAGNVSEWVQNTYYRYTYRDSIATPAFNAKHLPIHADQSYVGDTLILRGGSWYQSTATSFGSAGRQEYTRGAADPAVLQSAIMHCGFRIVLAK